MAVTSPTHVAAATPRRPATPFPTEMVLSLTLLSIVALCLALPMVASLPPAVGGNVLDSDLPLFSPGHLLGTDINGNDVLSRLLYGARTSLRISLAVNLCGLLLGGTLGAMAACRRGSTDAIVMRLLDVLLAFPSLVLVLAVAQALGPGETHTIWALSFFSVPAFARIARAASLRLREQPFILAAELSGTGTWGVLCWHITPNILPQMLTYTLLGLGTAINIEGAVSFLGLGVPLPQPSLGNMISQGQLQLSTAPVLVVAPSILLFIIVLSLNLLSETVRARWGSR